MSVHIHSLRNCCASALVLLPAFLVYWALAPGSTDLELAQVSGRVSCAEVPFSGEIYFQPERGRGPLAMGLVNSDGSYQLYVNGQRDLRGAVPGTYRVYVHKRVSNTTGLHLDSKYQDPRTTDLLVDIRPDCNYVDFKLR